MKNKKLIERPYLILFLAIPIILLLGILSADASLTINIHDTYFVITHFHLALLISILFGIMGVGYWIMQKTNRKLLKWLTWIHMVLTIGGLIGLLSISYLSLDSGTQGAFPLLEELRRKDIIRTLLLRILIFGQLVYLINMIIGIFKKNKAVASN